MLPLGVGIKSVNRIKMIKRHLFRGEGGKGIQDESVLYIVLSRWREKRSKGGNDSLSFSFEGRKGFGTKGG